MEKKSKKGLVIGLIILCVLIAIVPLFALKGAEFAGSDDGAGEIVSTIKEGYEPWATPLLEKMLGGDLPGEVESLIFCTQTGIGVGIIAYYMGRFVQRKKDGKEA